MAKMLHLTFWVDVYPGCDPTMLFPSCTPSDLADIGGIRRYRIECDVPDPRSELEDGVAENVVVHDENE